MCSEQTAQSESKAAMKRRMPTFLMTTSLMPTSRMSAPFRSAPLRSALLIVALLAVGVIGSFSLGCNRSANVAAKTSGPLGTPPPVEAVKEATFDDLKFDMEKGDKFELSLLTPQVKELFDRRIRIRGFIFPTLRKRGIKQFVLVRDNLECCFGPGAALFDCILVHMEEGKTAEYSIRPVAVEGKFSLEEFLDYDGTVRAIYRLDGESVD